MDLKNLFKKKTKNIEEPRSYDSLDSELDSTEKNIDFNYNTIKDNDTDDHSELFKSEDTKNQKGLFGISSNPFQSLLKQTQKNTETSFGFASRVNSKNVTQDSLDEVVNTDFRKEQEIDEAFEEQLAAITKSSSNNSEITMSNIIDIKHKKLPIIGRLAPKKQYQIAGTIAAISLLGCLYAGFVYNDTSTQQLRSLEMLSNLQTNAQKLDSSFTGTILGKKDSYDGLIFTWQSTLSELNLFNELTESLSGQDKQRIQTIINRNIDKLNMNVDVIKKNSEFLKNTAERASLITTEINNLSLLVDRLGVLYTQLGANQNEMADIYYLKTSLQSINDNTTKLLLAETVSPEIIAQLAKTRQNFKKTLGELFAGNTAKGIKGVPNGVTLDVYKDLAKTWVHFSNVIDTIVLRGPDLVKVRTLSLDNTKIIGEFDKSLKEIKELIKNNDFDGIHLGKIVGMITILIFLLSIILLFYIYNFERENRTLQDKYESNRTQTSIYRLLNEMSPLQAGDLTKKTTVTEEIIGTIADSINSTVESLASLVKKIKDTSFSMRQKTGEVNIISLDLLQSNEKQAESIQITGEDVIKITKSIREISQKTIEGAEVAQNSVKVSEQGAEQVLASIEAMKEINNNNNETVHLMKTVSDSSKQISDIVGLLSDIAEDTSILALNADVQAAKAGEAGKGFKIVADEIQQLADSAAEKARTVGALIASVQTAIQAVENAVSKTTVEVEKGVTLSEKAGESLKQITQVSHDLAGIVRTISEDAKVNAVISHQVGKNMQEILENTEQNKKFTQKTAESIAEISDLSNELGESVQTFIVE